jgi:type II secretory pathway pseudopilin PulG
MLNNSDKVNLTPRSRNLRGVSVIELVVAMSVLAIISSTSLIFIKFWKDQGIKSYNYGQVQIIKDALSIYLRTYGHLPDLSSCSTGAIAGTDCEKFANFYTYKLLEKSSNGSISSALPEGVSYTLDADYIPRSFTSPEVLGTVTLIGIGCDVFDKESSCTLRIGPS